MMRRSPTRFASGVINRYFSEIVEKQNATTHVYVLLLLALLFLPGVATHLAAQNRSTMIQYDSGWIAGPASKWIALDTAHHQVFTAWINLDRIDVRSTVDYHLIHTIAVPSPSTLDISPDGTTLAVGTSGSHILFFDTATFAKTNDIDVPGAALGVAAFLYTANGNAIIRAADGDSTGGGPTLYWNHAANSFVSAPPANSAAAAYQANGPLARSGDYSKVILGDATSAGTVQVIDGNTGEILWTNGTPGSGSYDGYIDALAVNQDGSRYAICVEPAGIAPSLVILNASYQEIYQGDRSGCLGMTFSADGSTLYRDVGTQSGSYTQLLNMSTVTARNVPNYFTQNSRFHGYATFWETADSSGMVYGMNSNVPNGTLWIALDTTASAPPQAPPVDNSLRLVRVIDNIGSPQGGDSVRLLVSATGLTQNSTSVTIGGANATVLSAGPLQPANLPNQGLVIVKTPPGTPGFADVVLTVSGSSVTASKAFQYAASTNTIPFATSPNFLLFDPMRNRLYASHKDQVEVIDVAGQKVLTPLVPASGKLPNSQFAGLSLSPDGNRLYIADAGANQIHVLDLTSPGQGYSIDVAKAIGSSSPLSPSRVFELSNGKLLGGYVGHDLDGTGGLFLIDPKTLTGDFARDSFGRPIGGYVWNSTNQGRHALISGGVGNADAGSIGLWNADAPQNYSPAAEVIPYVEAAANEDGTAIIVGGSTPGLQNEDPQVVDFNLYPLGYINQHFDVSMPTGTPSFFLDPTGALLYKAGNGSSGGGGLVEIDDMHQFQPAATVVFPEPFITSYSPIYDHMLTTDGTGRYLFGVTKSGITTMVLNTVPLSIGNTQPSFAQQQGGQTLTIRGSGFQAGAAVNIGGVDVNATYVDSDTLTVTTPNLTTGWDDVTVTLPDGASYTAPGLLQVIGPQPTPAVTGFSPASVIVQSGIAGFDRPATVTVQGSGFEVYDAVQINGEPVPSAFIDSSDIQATIPATLTGTTGSVSVAVISPYTGTSNVATLPMINPVPVVQGNLPFTVVPGSATSIDVYGTGLVAGSVIQWNGQNLPTDLNGGETGAGLESVFANVPASLTTQPGTAKVTVFNPAPGGGVSSVINVDVSPAHAVPYVSGVIGNNPIAISSFPANLNLGTALVNSSSKIGLVISNIGTANYTLSSASVTTGPFSLQLGLCQAIPPHTLSNCSAALTFSPTTAGTATAILTLNDNAPGSPHTISVTATGIETPVPSVTLTNIDTLGQTVAASFNGVALVGGSSVPATAWIEYGTDPSLSTFSQSPSWTFTGDQRINQVLSGFQPNSSYAGRLAVQTAGGIGRSGIQLFATAPAWPSVALQLAKGASNVATVTAGQTATYSLVAWDGGNGYSGPATFSCGPLPVGVACSISPSQAGVSTTATALTVTLTTTAANHAALERQQRSNGLTLAMIMLFGTGGIAASRKKLGRAVLLSSLCLLVLSLSACGGSSSSSGGGNAPPPPPTPAGTYYVVINAAASTAQTSYLLTLNVQ